MTKNELIKWLEDHPGWEFQEERNRLIEEHKDLAIEIVRDSIRDIVANFREMMDHSVDHEIEQQLDNQTEFPEVQELLKKF